MGEAHLLGKNLSHPVLNIHQSRDDALSKLCFTLPHTQAGSTVCCGLVIGGEVGYIYRFRCLTQYGLQWLNPGRNYSSQQTLKSEWRKDPERGVEEQEWHLGISSILYIYSPPIFQQYTTKSHHPFLLVHRTDTIVPYPHPSTIKTSLNHHPHPPPPQQPPS